MEIQIKYEEFLKQRFDIEFKIKEITQKNTLQCKSMITRQVDKLQKVNLSMQPLIRERFEAERDLDRQKGNMNNCVFFYKERDQYYVIDNIEGYYNFSEMGSVGS